MNQSQQEQWVNNVLEDVLSALMHDAALNEALVFKGARILNLHLGDSRQSMDIDAAAEPGWVEAMGSLDKQEEFLKEHLPRAVRRYFEAQNPVRFTLKSTIFRRKPAKEHPRGWDMLTARLAIQDNQLANVSSLPSVELEVSAAELYAADAVEMRDFLGVPARVYALHRIAGEKLRAYLTSLPAYRAKIQGGTREFRVKDLHDIARILRHSPLSDAGFWTKAMREFRLACESRYVDCAGPETFKQEWAQARQRYRQDTLLSAVSFADVELAMDAVLGAFLEMGAFPLEFQLPLK